MKKLINNYLLDDINSYYYKKEFLFLKEKNMKEYKF